MADSPIRVLLADDMPIILDGLEALLISKGIDVCGKVKNGQMLIDQYVIQQPDVVVTDIEMPVMDGITATQRLLQIDETSKIIGLTAYENEHYLADMIKAGAMGFLEKKNCSDELIAAIQAVNQMIFFVPKKYPLRLNELLNLNKPVYKDQKEINITEPEMQIIRLICKQKASKEIADETGYAISTVEKYRNNIIHKIGAQNVVGIVLYAIRSGIVKLEDFCLKED